MVDNFTRNSLLMPAFGKHGVKNALALLSVILKCGKYSNQTTV